MDHHITNKTFLNEEAYFQLIKAEKDPDVLEYIENTIKVVANYVAAVDVMETQLITARFRMDQNKYQETIMSIDKRRRALHNDAIASTAFLNRCAASHGFQQIFTGDQKDRYQVADFCLDLTTAIFKRRS